MIALTVLSKKDNVYTSIYCIYILIQGVIVDVMTTIMHKNIVSEVM